MKSVEEIKEYKKAWATMNREKRRASVKKWADRNREYLREKKRDYYKTRIDYYTEYFRQYRKNNRARRRLWWRNYRVRKLSALGSHTLEEWQQLKILYDLTCPKCFRAEPEIVLTEDHKIPISKGGTNFIDNIQPLCRSCNASKGTKTWFASYPINYMKNVNTAILA